MLADLGEELRLGAAGNVLVPDLVTMFTTEPELRLYSTPKLLVVNWYSCTQSVFPIKVEPGR